MSRSNSNGLMCCSVACNRDDLEQFQCFFFLLFFLCCARIVSIWNANTIHERNASASSHVQNHVARGQCTFCSMKAEETNSKMATAFSRSSFSIRKQSKTTHAKSANDLNFIFWIERWFGVSTNLNWNLNSISVELFVENRAVISVVLCGPREFCEFLSVIEFGLTRAEQNLLSFNRKLTICCLLSQRQIWSNQIELTKYSPRRIESITNLRFLRLSSVTIWNWMPKWHAKTNEKSLICVCSVCWFQVRQKRLAQHWRESVCDTKPSKHASNHSQLPYWIAW